MSTAVTLFDVRGGYEAISALWQQAIKPRLAQGHKLTVSVTEPKRTLPQNEAIQGLVRSIGKKIAREDHDVLRCLLMEQFNHETSRPPQHVSSWDGKRLVDVSNRSSALEKPEGSDFIEWLKATEAGL